MRDIFLDFDGVGHPVSDIADWREIKISPVDLPRIAKERNLLRWLPLLNDVLEEHQDVGIVVHSGWRGMVDNMQMREFLGALAPRFIGITSTDLSRYKGILEFAGRAAMAEYVIIDDAVHEYPTGLPELLATDPEGGLSDQVVIGRLRQWLERTTPKRKHAEAMCC